MPKLEYFYVGKKLGNNNPFCKGIHWTCGQEISIRLLNVILALTARQHQKVIKKYIRVSIYASFAYSADIFLRFRSR